MYNLYRLLFALVVLVTPWLPQANAAKDEQFIMARRQLVSCDIFKGSWIYDGSRRPLYNGSSCRFLQSEFDCQRNGRPDYLYLRYRWTPNGCELPRFKGKYFLRKMRGKKLLFVGDSLSLNQWQSLTCMLHTSVPKSNFSIYNRGDNTIFTVPEYGVSLTFSRNAFLVDVVKQKIGRVLKLNSIANGNAWKGYDVIVFNTWHWWLHTGRKQPWDFVQEGNTVRKDMDRLVAYRKGLITWSKWVESNINPAKTKVFFQGISPDHFNGTDWNGSKSRTCNGQSKPLVGSTYPEGLPPPAVVVKEVLSNMKVPVVLLDVTTLSQLRKDGHPSIYGFGGSKGNDCSHWCLPGVPDTWNELLYTMLIGLS